jgi:hypothetical protein
MVMKQAMIVAIKPKFGSIFFSIFWKFFFRKSWISEISYIWPWDFGSTSTAKQPTWKLQYSQPVSSKSASLKFINLSSFQNLKILTENAVFLDEWSPIWTPLQTRDQLVVIVHRDVIGHVIVRETSTGEIVLLLSPSEYHFALFGLRCSQDRSLEGVLSRICVWRRLFISYCLCFSVLSYA